MRRPTIKDVALDAGVSAMTVSRVINGEAAVRPALRERVMQAIKALGYQPDTSARNLRSSHAFSIGLVYDDNPNANYILSMQKGALSACREQRYQLLIHPCDCSSHNLVEELRGLVAAARLAGLVLTPAMSEDSKLLSQLRQSGIAFSRIVSARRAPRSKEPCVYVDDHQAAYELTSHLIRLGHSRIAFLWGDERYRSSPERYEGYADAMAAHGVPLDASLVMPGTYEYEDGFRRARVLLSRDLAPTAIFGANDEIAAGVLVAARSLGLEVPRDLSVIGFEDNPFSRQAWPPLTTAKQSTERIGECAASLLISQLGSSPQVVESVRFAPEVVMRQSTAAPAAHQGKR